MKQPIYLDYNATAPLHPQVREAMTELEGLPLNPSSVHYYGRMAKKLMEEARKKLAERLSAWPDEVLFTASATEANNMALSAFPGYRLAVAATEHSSILNAAKQRPDTIILPVDKKGLLCQETLAKILEENPGKLLVSVMLANNETGVIQPVTEIAKQVHAAGGLIHCDAVQAFGKIPLDFGLLGVDMLTLAAHKLGGPVGVGTLIVRNGLLIHPLLYGGGQEKRRRAGTENVAAIHGFGRLVEIMPDLSHLAGWRDKIETGLAAIAPQAVIPGAGAHRTGNTLCLTMPGISSETQLMNFDLAGICVSAGSACSSGRIEPSHVLQAMGYDKEITDCALRVSLGWATTEMEVERFIAVWIEMYQRLSKKAAA